MQHQGTWCARAFSVVAIDDALRVGRHARQRAQTSDVFTAPNFRVHEVEGSMFKKQRNVFYQRTVFEGVAHNGVPRRRSPRMTFLTDRNNRPSFFMANLWGGGTYSLVNGVAGLG
jgi:hypothetical protein